MLFKGWFALSSGVVLRVSFFYMFYSWFGALSGRGDGLSSDSYFGCIFRDILSYLFLLTKKCSWGVADILVEVRLQDLRVVRAHRASQDISKRCRSATDNPARGYPTLLIHNTQALFRFHQR